MTSDFWSMGGYATYVWGSFAAATVVFGWNIISVRLRRRDALRRLSEQDEDGAG